MEQLKKLEIIEKYFNIDTYRTLSNNTGFIIKISEKGATGLELSTFANISYKEYKILKGENENE